MSQSPYYQDEAVTIYHGAAAEILPTIDADLLLTDPPYNVGFNYGTSFRDNDLAHLKNINALFFTSQADRLVFFPGTCNLFDVPAMLDRTGYAVRQVLGWHRKEFAGDKWPSGPAMSWEPIVWASRGARAFNKIFGTQGRDFLVVNSTHGSRAATGHPCPKPIEVMRWLICLFAPVDGRIVDPFLGSGTTLRAAKDLGRKAIGIEIEERYCELAAKRMSQEVLSFSRLESP